MSLAKKVREKPLFYVYLYGKIRKKANGRFIISHGDIMEVFNRSIPWTPRDLYYPMIKEMEEKYSLLKKLDRNKYEIIGGKVDNLLNQYKVLSFLLLSTFLHFFLLKLNIS